MEAWAVAAPGVVRLPSGRLVRGRALRRPLPDGPPPHLGLYLLPTPPPAVPWESRWLRWRDWWLPADPDDARRALTDLWDRAADARVEVACRGGLGRTGTALACLAVLDGVEPHAAVVFVRRHYAPQAVEAPWQRQFVTGFRG